MQDDAFEWDDGKAAANWRRHRISFEMARAAFDDDFATEQADRDHDDAEECVTLLGIVEHHLLFLSYTLRGNRIRIMSARKAEPHERRQYHNKDREV